MSSAHSLLLSTTKGNGTEGQPIMDDAYSIISLDQHEDNENKHDNSPKKTESHLYKILCDNDIDLAVLKNDFNLETDFEDTCNDLNIKGVLKVKFKTLIRKIQTVDFNVDDHKITVILIGDSDAGKTCLMDRYLGNAFDDRCRLSTAGVGDKMIKLQIMNDDSIMEIVIWDTAGQERYQSVCQNYYRKADVILFCYDVTNEKSLDNCSRWKKQIEEWASDDVIIEFVGCKSDGIIHDRLKQTVGKIVNGSEWEKYNVCDMECSAKTGDNVPIVFITAAETIMQKRTQNNNERKVDREQSIINKAQQPPKQYKCFGACK